MEYIDTGQSFLFSHLVTHYCLAQIKLETSVSLDWGKNIQLTSKPTGVQETILPITQVPTRNAKHSSCIQQMTDRQTWGFFLIKGKYWFEQSTLQTQINNQTHNSFIFFFKSFNHCFLTEALKINAIKNYINRPFILTSEAARSLLFSCLHDNAVKLSKKLLSDSCTL